MSIILNEITLETVLINLHLGQWFGWSDSKNKVYANLIIHDEIWDNDLQSMVPNPYEKPTQEFLESELQKEIDAEPLKQLRAKRDYFLKQIDWWASSDLTMTAEQTAYRQELRDLPATASPKLDEDGQLTGVTWPENPKE